MAPYSNLTYSLNGPVPQTHSARQLQNAQNTSTPMSPTFSSSTTTSTEFIVVSTTVTSSPLPTVIVFTSPSSTRLASSALTRTNTRVLSNGAIIGIAVGGFWFIILVLVLAILLWRYKRRREMREAKYTPWSRINSGGSSNGRTGTTAISRPSNAMSEASMLEIPIPTPYLFDSPASLRPRVDPFRGSPVDGRAILKSLVPHDYPVPQLPTQQIPSLYLDNAPMKSDGSTETSSPSVYGSDPDLDDLSHKAVDPHNRFVTTQPRPLPIPLVLQPGFSTTNTQPLHIRNSKSLRIETGNEHSRYSQPLQMLKPPPAALTRSRSREARAMAELIKAIDASSPNSQRRSSVLSSRHVSAQSEIDNEPVGVAVTTLFKSRSPYGYSNASSQSSMTNTILHRLTADFPLPPASQTSGDPNS